MKRLLPVVVLVSLVVAGLFRLAAQTGSEVENSRVAAQDVADEPLALLVSKKMDSNGADKGRKEGWNQKTVRGPAGSTDTATTTQPSVNTTASTATSAAPPISETTSTTFSATTTTGPGPTTTTATTISTTTTIASRATTTSTTTTTSATTTTAPASPQPVHGVDGYWVFAWNYGDSANYLRDNPQLLDTVQQLNAAHPNLVRVVTVFSIPDPDLPRIEGRGFDSVTVSPYADYLDVLAAENLKGVVWLGQYDKSNCVWQNSDAWVRTRLAEIAGHPAIVGYQISDEPHVDVCPNAPQQHRDRTNLLHSLDPTKPTLTSAYRQEDIRAFANTTDVMGVDIYVCSKEFGGCNYAKLERAKQWVAAAGVNRYWPYLGLFADDWYSMPTAGQTKEYFRRWGLGITSAPQNLVSNQGFETSLSGWEPYGDTTLTRVQDGHSGQYAARIATTSSDDPTMVDSSPSVASTATGDVCTASAWIKASDPGLTVKIRLRENTGSQQTGYESAQWSTTGGWQQIFVSLASTVTGSAFDVSVYGNSLTTSQSILIDDLNVSCVR